MRLHYLTFLTLLIVSTKSRAWVQLNFQSVIKRNLKSILYLENTSSNDGITKNEPTTQLPRDENIWKKEGERIILKSMIENGGNIEDVDIQWKPGLIIVTISGDSILRADDDTEDDILEMEQDEDYEDAMQEFDNDFDNQQDEISDTKPNVVSIARAINLALGEEGEGSIGYNIAVHHSIEVTTPGASDELHGIMFQSYRGFDVIAETIDVKKNKNNDDKPKIKIVEGKLVERNEEHTVLNVKGRMKKLKNDLVVCVKLPKAKKESKMK